MRKQDEHVELALAPASQVSRPEHAATASELGREPSDAHLLVRIARGDREAFEELYRRYVRTVYGFALRRLGDRDRAEEAVQEVFASVWRSARSYRPERGPGARWLFAVARNAVIDRFRTRSELPAEIPDAPAADAGPEERVEAGWVAWRVHRALEELPESERTVLELAYWSGLSQSEVADFLGIPLGTVKTRTRSGLGRLATLLEGEDLR